MRTACLVGALGLAVVTAGCVQDQYAASGYSPGYTTGYNTAYAPAYTSGYGSGYSPAYTTTYSPGYSTAYSGYTNQPSRSARYWNSARRDADGDGIPHRYDRDANGDGIPDRYQGRPRY